MQSASELQFTRYPWLRRWFGLRIERVAGKFLRRKGFRILAHNWIDFHQRGEIDLLAVDRDTLVVVEVRSSQSADWMKLAASVNYEKKQRLTQATLRFLKRRDLLDVQVRFDVILVTWPCEQAQPEIRHFPNAFEATGHFQLFS